MKKILQQLRLLCFTLFFCAAQNLPSAETLNWETNRVDADIETWSLQTLLEKISVASGWDIYLEPGTAYEVSAKFKKLPVDEALKKLLGKLNYALLPQTNAAPKFYVYRTSVGHATQLVSKPARKTGSAKDDLIPNELIVTLKPDSGISIEELAHLLGAKIIGRDDKLHAYRLKFIDEEDALAAQEKLSENPDVASVDQNYRIHPEPTPTTLPLASTSPFPLNPTAINDPNNLILAMIDTSVQSLPADMQKFVLPEIAVAGDSPKSDELTHGTSMTEAALQAAAAAIKSGQSNIKILPVNVYGSQSSTTTYEIGLGINAAVNGHARIINLSLGTYGDSAFLATLIQNSARQGVSFFGSAGNEPVSVPVFPASYAGVTGVTAGKNGELEPYANRYPGNDLMLPGTSIGQINGTSYLVRGTSSSSASASGLAASLMSQGNLTAGQAITTLQARFPYKTAGQ
jgi:hypothetical protein